jgi:hypothetical protein
MRDGLPQRFVGQPPRSKERQRRHKDPEVKRKEKKKIDKARKHGYIVTKFVGITRSFMHFFSVPKGDDDIRMVYDGSRSGLNEVLWAPWFALPTVTSMCRTINVGYWCADKQLWRNVSELLVAPRIEGVLWGGHLAVVSGRVVQK